MKAEASWRFALVVLLLVSCNQREAVIQTEREDLFTLEIGRMEDQIALYDIEGDRGIRRVNIAMRDGLFYISDGLGAKILRYNSYGDLLYMVYNEEANPPPISLKPLQDASLVTRWAVPYPLNEPGEITVDSRNHIYVRDRLPYEKHGVDPESKALLDNVILHFDENGRFVEYLGRNGIGGNPFPRVEGIFTSVQDELAVVCRLPTGWDIYWFRSDGAFLYMVQIKNGSVPVPGNRQGLIPSLDSIAAAPDARRLYIKADYYLETFDEAGYAATGNEYNSSVVWVMNVEDGSWEKQVELPFFEYSHVEGGERYSVNMPYSMLGIIGGGRICLSFPEENGYSLLFLDPGLSGRERQKNYFIQVSDEEQLYSVFILSVEGILSAFLLDEWEAKLVWWRTDYFFMEGDS